MLANYENRRFVCSLGIMISIGIIRKPYGGLLEDWQKPGDKYDP